MRAGTSPNDRLFTLLELFPDSEFRRDRFEVVAAVAMPSYYQELLDHHHHMTVTLESHHSGSSSLDVLEARHSESFYSRRLRLRVADKVVMVGIMRIDLTLCDAAVRGSIVEEKSPLGRILIEHQVLRWIETESFLKVRLNDSLRGLFEIEGEVDATFGRIATIHCNHQPAVELLEIVRPEGV